MPAETDFPSTRNQSRDLLNKSAWVSVRRGAYCWDLQTLAYDWLNERGELPLPVWLDEQRATIIKTGPHRTVYRLKLPEGNFYLKHYRTPDWQAVLQNLVRPSKADLEWEAAQKVAQFGLCTFETVAVGRRKRFGLIMDNFLISREIDQVEPLDQFVLRSFPKLESSQQQAIRQDLARQLGQMTALLHRNGLLHRDFHPGNLLLQQSDDCRKLFLIDLHATSQKCQLSLGQIARNLSLLNNFFGRLTSKADRLRFLKSYGRIWDPGHAAKKRFTSDTVKRVDRICRSALEKADLRGDKKWKRGNRRLLILKAPPNHGRGLAGLGKEQLRQFCEKPEKLFERPHLIAWRKRENKLQQGVGELCLNGEPVPAILTAFPESHLARQGWEMGHALVRRRLPAPRPLLFVETPRGDWAYLAVEQIPGAVTLKDWLSHVSHPSREPGRNQKVDAVLQAVAFQFRRLHDHGFNQPEWSLSSLLIAEEESPPRIWFVSLESLQHPRRVDAPRVMHSLATLLGSTSEQTTIRPTDCLRFLRTYLGAGFSREWKSYWRGIACLMVDFSKQEAA